MVPVILSGGSGTRLWPVSRASYPKQFCELYDQSFLENSLERLKNYGEPYILTVESMRSLTLRTLHEMSLPTENAYFEPLGKNTAPAVALICHILDKKGLGGEVMGIFPADHIITKVEAFYKAVNLGIKCADEGEIVTLGVLPRYAATGYGYIEVKEEPIQSSGDLKALMVNRFLEKPDENMAQEFLNSGFHYWNAGMFIFKVEEMIKRFCEHLPDMWQKISSIELDMSNAKYNYANVESESLDYGIMEKLKRQVCIPCDIGWSDVGSWDEISRLSEELPELRSDSHASVFNEDSSGNYIFALRNKVVGLVGVDNLIVVDTPDALLISQKGQSQKVKNIVQQVKTEGLTAAIEHPFEVRPWGGFEILADNEAFKVKRITVDPGAQLSYQSHEKRAEDWVIVSGNGEVTLNDEVHKLNQGQSIHIPQKAKHRIANSGKVPLVFVEVQTGTYFGEDDIRRYQDDYNRI